MLRANLPLYLGLLIPGGAVWFLLQNWDVPDSDKVLYCCIELIMVFALAFYSLELYHHRVRGFIAVIYQYRLVSDVEGLLIVSFNKVVLVASKYTVIFMTFALLELMCIFSLFATQHDLRRMVKMIFIYSGSALMDLVFTQKLFSIACFAIFPFTFAVYLLLYEAEPLLLWESLRFLGCRGRRRRRRRTSTSDMPVTAVNKKMILSSQQ